MEATLSTQPNAMFGEDPMVPLPYLIKKVIQETKDTFTVEIAPESGEIPEFKPGQFNMIYIFGVGEIPISICGDPANKNGYLHSTRVVGTVTEAMKDLKKGDMLGIRGPFGSAWPTMEAQDKDVVIVAGGIGLAPLRPAIYQIAVNRKQYGKVSLLYGARTPEDILYLEELENWKQNYDIEVFLTVDRATNDWKGSVGVVPKFIARAPFDPGNAVTMICGPEIMMRFAVMGFQKRGVQDERIYLSMERNMKCAIGFCGHCQYGAHFICKDGPVFSYDQVKFIFSKREI